MPQTKFSDIGFAMGVDDCASTIDSAVWGLTFARTTAVIRS
jgi:hypothetical protein